MKKNHSLKDALVYPLMTEKTVAGEKAGKYTFRVISSADKIMIKKAVEDLYKVKVTKVNIVPLRTKKVMRRSGEGIKGKRGKKAIVTLKKGETINKK